MIPRYTLPEMGGLWSEDSKFKFWLEVELAVCRAMAEKGIIPQKALKTILKKANFDIKRINEIEAVTNHDVIAFLTSVGEYVGPDAKYIHYGMTSSDMLDTALSLQMKKAAVIIDKKTFHSCITYAFWADGKDVWTIEGVGTKDVPHPIQKALVDEGAVQCGYCIPGMVLSAKALFDKNPTPNEEEIKQQMDGNLCRCTGYEKIYSALKKVSAANSKQ